jgi:Zn-dependent metalloprotease/subtilisin family serine protease
LQAFAVRADRPEASRTAPAAASVAAQAPTADQRDAARSAVAAGLRVQWHPASGVPASVRGGNLARRGAFSGGKGAQALGAGAWEDDALAVLDNLSRLYRIRDAGQEFKPYRTDPDALGFRHVRVRQRAQGLPVVGGEVIVHFNPRGEAYEVNGSYVPDIAVDAVPRLTAAAAAQRAADDLAVMKLPAGSLTAPPALCVFALSPAPALAYELVRSYRDAHAGPGRWRYWVDAATGAVLLRYNDVPHVPTPAGAGAHAGITGNILSGEGGGVAAVTGWRGDTGLFYLHNTNEWWHVYNIAAAGYPDAGTFAQRATNDWALTDRSEMSLARNFALTQRYFRDAHGRHSFDDLGIPARANAHEGIAYANAYWDGTAFYFGDGDGVTANSLATLDISAHEFAHAVTEYTSGLIYADESGALNESFSDIFGACVEFASQPDGRALYPGRAPSVADWLVGEDCWVSATALRDMRSPGNAATVGSSGRQPSRYKGTHWDPNNEVHQNSGVQNFFFYLLCEGGSGVNDGVPYAVTGIGITNGAQLAYRVLTAYCVPFTGYRTARAAWVSAAEDLNTNWVPAVKAAWNAVDVSGLSITPADAIVFRGPLGGPFSRVSAPLTLANFGAAPLDWSLSHTQSWVSAPSAGSVPGAGSATLDVSINGAAGALPRGVYADTLTISNLTEQTRQTRRIVLQVGQKDYFTELFPEDWEQDTANPHLNDLAYSTLTFTPDGSTAHAQSHYRANRDPATAFPGPTNGTVLAFGADGVSNQYLRVDLAGGANVWLYGVPYSNFFIGGRGYITFGSGDYNWMESFAAHFDRPRISALFDAADAWRGRCTWTQLVDRVVVTFQNVPGVVPNARNNYQYELFFDGTIRLTYLELATRSALAGLSKGGGVPADFVESDLSAYGPYAGPPDTPDALLVQPLGGFPAQGFVGGPFSPAQCVYTLSNTGAVPLAWTAVSTQDWVHLSAVDGTLPAGGVTNVTVALAGAATNLGAGAYNDTVIFSNTLSGAVRSRPVTLDVRPPAGDLRILDSIAPATDTNLPFGPVIVGVPSTEQIVVTNADLSHPVVLHGIALDTGVYQEDFDDGQAQGWTGDNEANWRVEAGQYLARGTASDYMVSTYGGQVWTNVAAQAQWYWTDTPVGSGVIVLRASADFDLDIGSAYAFQIRGSEFSVYKQVGGLLQWLKEWTGTQAILTGVNTLTATAQGSSLAFYINGSLAWSGTDTALSAGRIGLGATVTSEQFQQRFDRVRVWESLPNPFPAAAASRPPFSLSNLPSLPATLAPGEALAFDVTYEPSRVGHDVDSVILRSDDVDAPLARVSLSGEGVADDLRVTPEEGVALSGHPGGPFTPSAAVFAISNAGPVAAVWTATSPEAWLDVLPAAGTLEPGGAGSVTVSPNALANGLPLGEYVGAVTFSNLTTTGVNVRQVRLSVFTSPELTLTPPTLAVTNLPGGSTERILALGNAEGTDGALSFQLLAREIGRSVTEPGAGSPPAARDFTKVAPGAAFRPGRVLVRFAAGQTAAARVTLLARMGGAGVAREYTRVPGLCVVNLGAGQTIEQVLAAWNGMPGILYAEPDYEVRASLLPDDPRFPQLWGLENTGQNEGTPDADIDAPEAWNLQTGSRSIVVAVIDSGVDYTHEDLAANVWRNPGEIAGNGMDDDGNGYVDDVHGINAITASGDPMDDAGHGTHVAGTIGAIGNNGVGVAGVCWNAGLMALKFLSDNGRGYNSDAIACFEYAIRHGAKVVNCSWGGGEYQQSLKDAIDAAGAAGIIVCAAAGNDTADLDDPDADGHYPAGFDSPNLVAVMATDTRDESADFSNYGRTSVDLAAPGTLIVSARRGGGYLYMAGTSMAAPHVAGACALLLSQNSLLSPAGIKSALLSTVDIPTTPLDCVSGGRLNLARALTRAGSCWLTATPATATNILGGAVTNVRVRFEAGGLLSGIYTGELAVVSNDRTTPWTNVPCVMVVAADDLGVSPVAGLSSTGPRGGPFAPDHRLYAITNRGAGTIHWTAVCTQAWAVAEPSSGVLPPGASATVTARLSSAANTLQPGSREQTLFFVNQESGARQQRALSVYVSAIVSEDDLVISPAEGLLAEGPVGGPFAPSAWAYRLVNVSQETLTWSAQCAQDWLSLAPEGGTLLPGEVTNVAVWINAQAAALGDGVHEARVDFLNEYSGMVQSRGVVLNAKALPTVPFGPGIASGAMGIPLATNLCWNDTGATALVGRATRSALDVLVCGTYQPAMDDVRAKLMAAGQFRSVTNIDPKVETPTLGQLQAFDVVIVAAAEGYTDSNAWGNVMADYFDSGGGVVCMLKECTDSCMGGRWLSQTNHAIPHGTFVWGSVASLGTVHQPLHPVMWGVTSFHGGSQSWRPATTSVLPGSVRVADWSDGKPLAVTKTINGRPRADLGFYPPSSDAAPIWWAAATDGGKLMANAVKYVGEAVYAYGCTFDVYLGTESPPTNCLVRGLKKTQFNPGPLASATTYYWQVIASNDAGVVAGPVWSFTTTANTPVDWLARHGLTNAAWQVEEMLDQDGDGFQAWQEYITGTDPTNRASCFRVLGIAVVEGCPSIRFFGTTNSGLTAPFGMRRMTNLLEAGSVVDSAIPRNSTGTNVWIDTAPPPAGPVFYWPVAP